MIPRRFLPRAFHALNAALKITVSFSLFLIVFSCLGRAQVLKEGWQELKNKHFKLYYLGANPVFPERVLQLAEQYYDEVAKSLGYARRSDFWLWENRALIYLYETKDEFHEATKQPAWSNGFAVLSKRTIVSFQGSEEFLESVLPHELAHLIFRDFVGGNKTIPLWMDEGLAMAQEKKRIPELDQLVTEAIRQKKWIPLDTFIRIRSLHQVSSNEAALFYAQAQSLVRFLLSSSAGASFVALCRDLRDGHPLEEAIRKNYPKTFRSLKELETKWVEAHA
ncbi:MAG: hypothetical protein HY584_01365 [Candidatus Omnitrophica bacterium]|nr:hypothetical protein [Candidatus Omnitrophota bacterium]